MLLQHPGKCHNSARILRWNWPAKGIKHWICKVSSLVPVFFVFETVDLMKKVSVRCSYPVRKSDYAILKVFWDLSS